MITGSVTMNLFECTTAKGGWIAAGFLFVLLGGIIYILDSRIIENTLLKRSLVLKQKKIDNLTSK